MEAMGKEEKRETCESWPLHFRAVPAKPGNYPPCRSHSPHQELWTPGSIPFPSALHGKERYSQFMAGSTCPPGLGAQGCWTLGAMVQGVDSGTGGGRMSSALLEPSPKVDMWWRRHVVWGGFLDEPARNSWLQLPYNPLCWSRGSKPESNP